MSTGLLKCKCACLPIMERMKSDCYLFCKRFMSVFDLCSFPEPLARWYRIWLIETAALWCSPYISCVFEAGSRRPKVGERSEWTEVATGRFKIARRTTMDRATNVVDASGSHGPLPGEQWRFNKSIILCQNSISITLPRTVQCQTSHTMDDTCYSYINVNSV